MTRETIKKWSMAAIPVGMIVALFALRSTLVEVGSVGMAQMQDERIAANVADSVRLLYDYRENGDKNLEYTFLEFGAKGCISCRKMERVMEEVKRDFAGRVKVRFLNVSEKEAQEWTKFFGVVVIPTQIVLDPTGREVFRHTGFISAEDLSKVFK